MKNLFSFLFVLAFLIGATTAANATMYTFEADELNDGNAIPLNQSADNKWGNSLELSFDLSGLIIDATEYVTSATITIDFNDTDDGSEAGTLFASTTGDTFTFSQTGSEWDVDNIDFELTQFDWVDEDVLKCTLTATSGGFWYVDSSLTIETSPVPEPATMLLFGTGLIGLAAGYRKKRIKK